MWSSLLSLAALFTLASARPPTTAYWGKSIESVGFGSTWWIEGYGTSSATHVVHSKTTLEVPQAPNPQVDRLALWPGMLTTNNQLIQSIIVSFAHPDAPAPGGCSGAPGQWCVFASLYTGSDQQSGNFVPVNAGDLLDMEYAFDEGSGVTTQTVTRNGQVLSTFSSNSGAPFYWDIAVECQDDSNGPTPAHRYLNTVITLNQPDMNWLGTLYKSASSDSGVTSPDNGLTFHVDTINIDSSQCTPQ